MTANRIIAHVFQQTSLQLVNEAAMEQLVADHPYFSAARLLLARKTYQQTGNLHHPAVKKALLYSDQRHYAYQLITQEQVLQEVEDRVAAVIPEDTLPEEDTLQQQPDVNREEEETFLQPAEDQAIIPEPEKETLPENAEEQTITSEEEVLAQASPETNTFTSEFETTAPEEENTALAATTATTPGYHTTAPETAAPIAVADFEPGDPGHTVETLPPPVAVPSPTNGLDAAEEINAADGEESSTGPIRIFPLATAKEETELVFQPLYTDDYFAYKRLKNPEEADDLNEQGVAEMRSFTSWLRQMKDNFAGKTNKDWYHQQLHRLYDEDEEPEVSETVEKMAMDSIVFNNDIVSETLAEIWVRQQQYGNAIKIYQKLSLLNPDKNAYFAQKILDLKSKTDKNKQ
ncbi:hypothetical protein [Chitinophaga sp. OAE865]|uniref:hypothetical protein n=1 Tax=Chitinophaga sp. OAE865 TaxID=2817898 RepID=UPI001AE93595